MAMRLRRFTTLYLCFVASAFNIITPRPGEVINVDKYYNLTWTTETVPANSIVDTIQINFPDPALLYAAETLYAYALFEESYNISATDGYYTLGLRPWWSPAYNELPHGSWSISLNLYNPAETHAVLNDTVEVELTSLAPNQDHRPQLPPIRDSILYVANGGDGEAIAASGVLPVVLSVVMPIIFIALTIWLLHYSYRWKHHAYGSLSNGDNVKQADTLLPSWPSAAATRANEETSRISVQISPRRLPRRFLLSAILAIAPLLALLTALVSLLLLYKVKPSRHSRTDFLFNESGSDPAAFYVDYDATRYTTVASWTSSIALLLPGFLTSLIWYRQTQQLESDASLSQYDKLLTPYQLSLLLNLKSGTLGALWEYVSYILSRNREKQARFLFDTGFIVLVSTLLGLGLWMADTWLHIGTSTVPFTTAFSYTAFEANFSLKPYGRALTRNCTTDYLTSIGQNYSCILMPLLSDVPPVLTDSVLYASVISERDEDTAIIPVTLGEDRLAYLGPASVPKQIDYRANTFAVRSVCETIDEWCWLPFENGSIPTTLSANCGKFIGVPANSSEPITQGTIVAQGVVGAVTSFFRDQDWQEVMTYNNTSNSFYTVSRLDSPIKPSSQSLSAYSVLTKGGVLWNNFIGCNTEFVNFTYTYVNGSISSADITPLQNLDFVNAIYLPTLYNFDPFISGRVAITAMADNVDSALENFIDAWHKHYLSLAAIATEDADNIDQQERVSKLVARIPKAPLFTLGMLLILSILFNCVILFKSVWRTNLRKTHPKQMIVSIAGLAANSFDSKVANTGHAVSDLWDLFEESKEESPSTRIAISENLAGGHHFAAFVAQAPSMKDFDQGRVYEPANELRERKLPEHCVMVEENDCSNEINIAAESS